MISAGDIDGFYKGDDLVVISNPLASKALYHVAINIHSHGRLFEKRFSHFNTLSK
jgi:hypothetical protein